ncbi:MAG: hypothetical protein EBT07_13370 [Actinobacteria bacterium]|nr:hypothetical protein [Actinomycetota bacterium]
MSYRVPFSFIHAIRKDCAAVCRPSQAGLTSPTLGQEDGRGKTTFSDFWVGLAKQRRSVGRRVVVQGRKLGEYSFPNLLSYYIVLDSVEKSPHFGTLAICETTDE